MQKQLSKRIKNLQNEVISLKNKKSLMEKDKDKHIRKLEDFKDREIDVTLAVEFLKHYIGKKKQEVVSLIQETVTAGLYDVFGDDYEFKIELVQQKNDVDVRILLRTPETKDFVRIEYTQGTCIKQFVSVVIRIIVVSMLKNVERTVILDEPFSGAEKERKPLIGEFISSVSERFGVQLIFVTHDKVFENYADKVVRI